MNMPPDPSIPIVLPAQVTADWMSRVLAHAGIGGRLSHIEGKKVGTGQVGESVRFTLTYEDGPGSGPATVVGKFPSPDPESRATGVGFGNYLREVRFYQVLAPDALVTTPIAHYADVDEASGEFVLIMEDLAPAEQGDQMAGLTVDRTALVLGEAAKMHAAFWGQSRLDSLHYVSESTAAIERASGQATTTPDLMRQLWNGFRDRYGDRIKPEFVPIGDLITSRFEDFKTGYAGPRCLIHNDFRPDNMMFGTADGGYPCAVVDWQSYGFGCCMADVSYFMAGALSPQERRANEKALLKTYHDQLRALGVSDYSFEQLWSDYARYSFSLFNMAYAASMIVERTERGDNMFFSMLESGANMVLDLDAMRLFES
jgi:hypothetical protein